MLTAATFEETLREAVRAVVREELRPVLDRLDAIEKSRTALAEARPEFVTVRDAATMVSVDPSTVRRWLKGGQLKRWGAGSDPRVRVSDLIAFLARGGDDRGATIDFDAKARELLARSGRKPRP